MEHRQRAVVRGHGGNTTTRATGFGGTVSHRADRTTTRVSAAYLNSAADGTTNAQSLSLRARQGLRFGDRFQAFGEAVFARNRFAGIDGEAGFTAGVAFAAATSRPHQLTLEAGGGVTAERRVAERTLRFANVSAAAHYTWTVVPGTRLSEDATLTVDVQSRTNWRHTTASTLTVVLSRPLSVKATHAFEYRRSPVAGFRSIDMRTSTSLVFSLR
ncbi:MAG: DUF481 domain-containing protein [Vicinamibacterales bacterium]